MVNLEWALKIIDNILDTYAKIDGDTFIGNVDMQNNKLYISTPQVT
jgi:hypothetical protein